MKKLLIAAALIALSTSAHASITVLPNTMVGSWCPGDIAGDDQNDEYFSRNDDGGVCVYAGITLAVKPRGYDIIEGTDFIKGRCNITRLKRNKSDFMKLWPNAQRRKGRLPGLKILCSN